MTDSTKNSAGWAIWVTVAAAAGVAAGYWWAKHNRDAVVRGIDNVIELCDAAAASLEQRLETFASPQTA